MQVIVENKLIWLQNIGYRYKRENFAAQQILWAL